MKGFVFYIATILFLSLSVQGQRIGFNFEETVWNEVGVKKEFTEYKNKDALKLPEGNGERCIYIKNYIFENGIIELDIAALPGYVGLVFRVRDDYVYEGIYFRPQNSNSSNAESKNHTVQYIASPMYTWYYLRDTEPEKFESYAKLELKDWFHVKVVVNGAEAEVFVNNENEPCLTVDHLKYGISSGSIGLWVGNGSPGTFANLSVTPLPNSEITDSSSKTIPVKYSQEQEYLFNTFKSRRSVRNFKSDPVPQEHIMKILEMASTSPTSGNQQPWKFFVIQDRNKLDELKTKCIKRRMNRLKDSGVTDQSELDKRKEGIEKYYTNYLSAPVYILVLTDSASKYPGYNRYDGSAAAALLMVTARALGYGTVFSQDSVPYELIKEVFNVPNQYERICFTPIGVPVEWPDGPDKKPLYDLTVFENFIDGVNYNKWINKTE